MQLFTLGERAKFQSGLKLEDSSFNSNEKLRLKTGSSEFYQAWSFLSKLVLCWGFEKMDS